MKAHWTHLTQTLVSLTLVLALLFAFGAPALAQEDQSVTIAVTDTIGALNPLLVDGTEVVKYANSLTFLPLVELNRDVEFVGQLAEKITTEDNLTFTIKLNDKAAWSDGTPVTSRDVLFTFLLWTSPEVGNTGMNNEVVVPAFGVQAKLAEGDTQLVFTPTEPGAYLYSCWMGMLKSTIVVTENEPILHSEADQDA